MGSSVQPVLWFTQRALGNKMYHHLPPTAPLLGEWVRKSETNMVRQKTVLLSIHGLKWTKKLQSIRVNRCSPVRPFACCQLCFFFQEDNAILIIVFQQNHVTMIWSYEFVLSKLMILSMHKILNHPKSVGGTCLQTVPQPPQPLFIHLFLTKLNKASKQLVIIALQSA